MNRSLFSIAGAVLIVAPALADEAPPVRRVQRAAPVREAPVRQAAAPAQAQPSWTGAQVGGQGGVANMAQGFAEPRAYLFPSSCAVGVGGSECIETPFSFNPNKTSATGGGFLGYRIQFGTFVAGIEGDINAKSASASYSLTDSNRFRAENFYGTASQGADGSIRGRLGFLVTPWTLVYGTGGVAFGGVSGLFSYSARELTTHCPAGAGFVCASAAGGGSWSTTRTGATGGGGVETMLTNYLTLRLEYRYSDLGNFSETVPLRTVCGTSPLGAPACSSPSSAATINLHPTFQTVMVGIGYNF
jgi:outer membrane immunogenic protein